MTEERNKEKRSRIFSYASAPAISVIFYLISYYGLHAVIIKENTIFQILIQTNITFLGFYLLCVTFVIKKFEDSRKEYDKLLTKFEHEVDKLYSYKSKQILPYKEKYSFYNSPLFNYSLKDQSRGLTTDDIKKGIQSEKKFENFTLIWEKGKKQFEKTRKLQDDLSGFLISSSIYTIGYVLVFSLVISSSVFLFEASNSFKWNAILLSFLTLYQMVYTIYEDWKSINRNVKVMDDSSFELQNILTDFEEYKRNKNVYIPSTFEKV